MRQYWENFVNFFFRDASVTTRAATLVTLIMISIVSLIFAFRGKGKGVLIKNYWWFTLTIITCALATAYAFITK